MFHNTIRCVLRYAIHLVLIDFCNVVTREMFDYILCANFATRTYLT